MRACVRALLLSVSRSAASFHASRRDWHARAQQATNGEWVWDDSKRERFRNKARKREQNRLREEQQQVTEKENGDENKNDTLLNATSEDQNNFQQIKEEGTEGIDESHQQVSFDPENSPEQLNSLLEQNGNTSQRNTDEDVLNKTSVADTEAEISSANITSSDFTSNLEVQGNVS